LKTENLFQREIRLLGYTQKKLAEVLGTTKQMVSLWCTGKQLISASMVKKLQIIGVSKKAIADPTSEV